MSFVNNDDYLSLVKNAQYGSFNSLHAGYNFPCFCCPLQTFFEIDLIFQNILSGTLIINVKQFRSRSGIFIFSRLLFSTKISIIRFWIHNKNMSEAVKAQSRFLLSNNLIKVYINSLLSLLCQEITNRRFHFLERDKQRGTSC